MVVFGKKLLVLGFKGFLADAYYELSPRPDGLPENGFTNLNKYHVYDRPFRKEFLDFCFQNFVVGLWSSSLPHNVSAFSRHVFTTDNRKKLAFTWTQDQCKDTGYADPDNEDRPVFLKELSKLWNGIGKYDLPWAAGDYGPSNTVLIDDSPYKALNNPAYTGIFPKTFKATDQGDSFLLELRGYLAGLVYSPDVREHISNNPIGGPGMSIGDPQWSRIFNASTRWARMKQKQEMSLLGDRDHFVVETRSVPARLAMTRRLGSNEDECRGRQERSNKRW